MPPQENFEFRPSEIVSGAVSGQKLVAGIGKCFNVRAQNGLQVKKSSSGSRSTCIRIPHTAT